MSEIVAFGPEPLHDQQGTGPQHPQRWPAPLSGVLGAEPGAEAGPPPQTRKLASNIALVFYVAGMLTARERLSPEQISARLRIDFADDESMRLSPETIYQCIYAQGRGGLRSELITALRTGRAVRQPNRRAGNRKPRVLKELLISERRAEADDRAFPGHWEGDAIIGILAPGRSEASWNAAAAS